MRLELTINLSDILQQGNNRIYTSTVYFFIWSVTMCHRIKGLVAIKAFEAASVIALGLNNIRSLFE